MESKCMEIYEKVARLQWLLQRQHIRGHMAHGPFADPSRGQGRVLALLRMQPEISTKDLSYLLGIRQQSLNELLGKLEKGGYVVRVPSEADRRVMMVQLTDKGKEEPQENVDHSDIYECLTPEEQENLGEYLDRIIAALEARLGMNDDEDVARWMNAARERMGEEMFSRLTATKGGADCSGRGKWGFFSAFAGFDGASDGYRHHGGHHDGHPHNHGGRDRGEPFPADVAGSEPEEGD